MKTTTTTATTAAKQQRKRQQQQQKNDDSDSTSNRDSREPQTPVGEKRGESRRRIHEGTTFCSWFFTLLSDSRETSTLLYMMNQLCWN